MTYVIIYVKICDVNFKLCILKNMCEIQHLWMNEPYKPKFWNKDNIRQQISYSLWSEAREHNEEILKNAINITLKEIFSNNIISKYLGLKWGLVANFYWLRRKSTDIDLDILDLSKYEIIINEIRKLLQSVGKIRDESSLESWYRFIAYRKIWNEKARIQIDLNKHVYKSNNYNFQEFDWTQICQMTKDCVFSNKLVSLSERLKDTDLYDVNALLKNNFPINEEIIKERTWMELQQFIEYLITILDPQTWYYQTTLVAKMPRIFQGDSDKNRIRFENIALLQETIILLEDYKDKLTAD